VSRLLTPAELAEILGVNVSIVQKHIGSLLGVIKHGDSYYFSVEWVRKLIEYLRFQNQHFVADVIEARLEEWLAANP